MLADYRVGEMRVNHDKELGEIWGGEERLRGAYISSRLVVVQAG